MVCGGCSSVRDAVVVVVVLVVFILVGLVVVVVLVGIGGGWWCAKFVGGVDGSRWGLVLLRTKTCECS